MSSVTLRSRPQAFLSTPLQTVLPVQSSPAAAKLVLDTRQGFLTTKGEIAPEEGGPLEVVVEYCLFASALLHFLLTDHSLLAKVDGCHVRPVPPIAVCCDGVLRRCAATVSIRSN